MNGIDKNDFRINVNRIGSTPEGDQYEYELSLHSSAPFASSDIIARAVINWTNNSILDKCKIINSTVYEQNIDKICDYNNLPKGGSFTGSYSIVSSIPTISTTVKNVTALINVDLISLQHIKKH